MRFAVVSNTTEEVLREFDAPDDYVAPSHKFGPSRPERVVVIVQSEAPALLGNQELRATQEITATEIRRGWVAASKPVPQEAAMWALKELCLVRGHAADIEAALNSLPDPPRTIARNRWENKDTISRNSPIIESMRQMLGWTNAYVDELFVAADALSKS